MANYLGENGLKELISKIKTYHTGENAIDVATDGKISLAINSNDKVLSQTSDGLLSTLSIKYDDSNRVIQLCGIDGAVISSFDASEFIVDGMIQSVELVTVNPETGATGEFIAITWNTEGGGTTTTYLDVTELVDVYTAGNGINISNNEISINIANGSEEYLTVNSDGLALNGVSDAITEAVNSETSRAEAAEAELQAAINAAVAGESTTVVEQGASNEHVTVSSSTSGTTTTYTINEDNIASASDIPTKVSDLTNDANYVTESSLSSTLSGYVTESTFNSEVSSLESGISGKQDTLTAGTNITISNNVISAVDTTYDEATTSSAGLMSASDKAELDSLASGAVTSVSASGTSPLTLFASLSGNSVSITGSVDLSDYAKTTDIPTATSQLTNDSGYITGSDIPSLGDLGGVGTVNASGSGDLTLSASKSGTTVTITGSLDISEITVSDVDTYWDAI